MSFWKLFIILVLVLVPPVSALAQQLTTFDEIKATFVTNYVSYIKWKEKDKPINICVMEGDPVATHMRELKDAEKFESYTISISEKSKSSSFEGCNILYINADHFIDFPYVLNLVAKKRIFTISDHKKFVQKGGIAAFYFLENNETLLEMNVTNLAKANIEVSADLINVMKIYK